MIGHCLLAGIAVNGVIVLASLAGVARAAEPPAAPTVFWHESETGVQAPESIGPPVGQRDTASGGAFLRGDALTKMGSTATYELDIPRAMDNAQLIFRYARAHWRRTMVPAHFAIELAGLPDGAGGGATYKGEAEFTDTKGWGYKPSEWGVTAPVQLGSLKAGKYTLKLTGLGQEHDVLTDGFFLASPDFKITVAELALTAIAITSDGYMGLQSATTVNQDASPTLRLVARGFSREPHVTLALGKTEESAVLLTYAGTETSNEGAVVTRFNLPPKLDDGDYVLVAAGQWPQCRLVVPVVLAGQFIAALDGKIHELEVGRERLE